MAASLQQRLLRASPETRDQVERLLQQDADDRAWTEQLGPAYRQGDVAQLLAKSRQAVSADRGLLRLEMRNGDIGYPVFQFDGRRPLPGLREVVRALEPAVASSWTIASWLTSPAAELDQQTPLALLRDGQTEAVIELAQRAAAGLSH